MVFSLFIPSFRVVEETGREHACHTIGALDALRVHPRISFSDETLPFVAADELTETTTRRRGIEVHLHSFKAGARDDAEFGGAVSVASEARQPRAYERHPRARPRHALALILTRKFCGHREMFLLPLVAAHGGGE